MKKISTLDRCKLKKAGIPVNDYNRVVYPLEYTFSFTRIDKDVKIEKAQDVLPPHIFNAYMALYPCFKAQRCHRNSLIACKHLSKYGVKIVDGYYIYKDDKIKRGHSFLEYNGRYFDPTIEFAITPFKLSDFDYHADKSFDAKERNILCCALSYLMYDDFDGLLTALSSNTEVLENDLAFNNMNSIYFLNDSGKLEYYQTCNQFAYSAA